MSPSTVFSSRCPKQFNTKSIQLSTQPMYSPAFGSLVITFHTYNIHSKIPTNFPGITIIKSSSPSAAVAIVPLSQTRWQFGVIGIDVGIVKKTDITNINASYNRQISICMIAANISIISVKSHGVQDFNS